MNSFSRLPATFKRSVLVLFTVILLVATANAYTVVMRGGRRIQIPSQFVVTPYTLTYEVGQGIQVTLQMAAVDIVATEKANNEAPGALLKRASIEPSSNVNALASLSMRRTITNRDLEATSKRRRESEVAYEKRIKQLGLPSLEESRSRAAAESEVTQRELAEIRENQNASEAYWRSRANTLRTEIAALDAEIRFVRMKLEEMPSQSWGGSFSSVTSIVPFISFGNFGGSFGSFGGRRGNFGGRGGDFGGRGHFPRGGHRPSVYVAPNAGPQLGGRFGVGRGATRGQVLINPGRIGHRAGPIAPLGVFANSAVYGSVLPSYDYSYERSELITHFNELSAARAGLGARWRELEDEARRAGAPPGWLRE